MGKRNRTGEVVCASVPLSRPSMSERLHVHSPVPFACSCCLVSFVCTAEPEPEPEICR